MAALPQFPTWLVITGPGDATDLPVVVPDGAGGYGLLAVPMITDTRQAKTSVTSWWSRTQKSGLISVVKISDRRAWEYWLGLAPEATKVFEKWDHAHGHDVVWLELPPRDTGVEALSWHVSHGVTPEQLLQDGEPLPPDPG